MKKLTKKVSRPAEKQPQYTEDDLRAAYEQGRQDAEQAVPRGDTTLTRACKECL